MTAAWRQWRELGVPRCHCHRPIWPWQRWVCEIEEWPQHHDCYHRHLVGMRRYVIEDNTSRGRDSDDYATCEFCGWETAA